MSRRFFIVAGEASGDKHGARLVEEINRLAPGTKISGICGPALRDQGVEPFLDSRALSVIGGLEVLDKLGLVLRTLLRIRREFKTRRPDLVILIDFPDFNFRVAQIAHHLGIPVVYYISPQIWAWRRGRVRQVARWVDKMIVIFPFEKDFYAEYGINAEFVGHPLMDDPVEWLTRNEALDRLGLSPDKRYIGLLPGSRMSEVKLMFPSMLEAAARVRKRLSDVEFILPVARTLDESDFRPYLQGLSLPVHMETNRFQAAMQCLDAALVASGSATLETAMLNVPLCIVYRLSPISYVLGKALFKLPFLGIINLIAGREIAKELLQHDAVPHRMASELVRLMTDAPARKKMLNDFQEIRSKMGKPGASRRAAEKILELPC